MNSSDSPSEQIENYSVSKEEYDRWVPPFISGDTFCIYCQCEYQSPRRLVTHIKRKHPGTYAYYSYVEKPDAR